MESFSCFSTTNYVFALMSYLASFLCDQTLTGFRQCSDKDEMNQKIESDNIFDI